MQTIDLSLFSPPKVKLIRKKFSDHRVKKKKTQTFLRGKTETHVCTMAFWASFVQKNVRSLSQAPLYPTAPPMPGKRWGGRLCALAWMAFPKKVILTITLGAFLQEVSPIHASIRGSAVSSLLLRHHDNLTVHVPACWNRAARNSHHEEETRLDLQSKHYFFFVGKEYLHIGTNTFYFPLSRWKNTCYCIANILVTCAKSQKWREKLFLSREESSPHLLRPWLREVQH